MVSNNLNRKKFETLCVLGYETTLTFYQMKVV